MSNNTGYPGAKDVNNISIARFFKNVYDEDGDYTYEQVISTGVTPTSIITLNNKLLVRFHYFETRADNSIKVLSPEIYMGTELSKDNLLEIRDEIVNLNGVNTGKLMYLSNLINNDVRTCMSFNGDIEVMPDDAIVYEQYLKELDLYYQECLERAKKSNLDEEYNQRCLGLIKNEVLRYNNIHNI